MKIAIIGAGGVGGYIGGKLIKSGQFDVTLIARGSHLEAIKKDGLTILDEKDTFSVSQDFVTDDIKENKPYDFLIFTTKAYDLEEVCESVMDSITIKTILMTTANGVGYKEKLKKIFPSNMICESCIYILSNIKEPGVIKKYGGAFKLFIGSNEIPNKKLDKIYKIFTNAGLNTKVSKNIELQCWRKYLFISAFATMTSFYDISIGAVVESHEKELKKTLKEIIALANKKGIELTNKNLEKVIDQAKNKVPYKSTTSMLLDFRNGKKTELEALTGYICHEADRLDIQVPNMKKFYEGLLEKEKAMEKG